MQEPGELVPSRRSGSLGWASAPGAETLHDCRLPVGYRPAYVELHCHSAYSLREGASTPLELVLRARELGYDTLALTDHDGLYGAMEFGKGADAWGVRPITGAGLTLAAEGRGMPVNGYDLAQLEEAVEG